MSMPERPATPARAGVHRALADVKRQLDSIRAALLYAQEDHDPAMLPLVEAVTTLHGAVVSLTGAVDQLTTGGHQSTMSVTP